MHSKTLLLLVLCSILCKSYADESDTCKTATETAGQCIVIRQCASLYALLIKKPMSQADTNLLRRSHCGFEGNIPKVCCPNEADTMANRAPIPGDDVLPSNTTNLLPDTADCGIDTGKRIVGGESTELDEFPWMALIIYDLPNSRQGYGCGGVLISKRYVLTAAHCLKGKGLPKTWRLSAVRLGEYDKDSDNDCINNGFTKECLKSPPIDVQVQERIAHENYDPEDPDQKHDIALLRLRKEVEYTDYIKPICLPLLESERQKTYSGANLTVSGWGQTENRSSSNVKLKLVVPVKSNANCNSIYKDANRKLSEQQLCAGGEKNKDSCKGDSGGPLMTISIDEYGDAIWYAVGIVSYGPDPCGTPGWPGVYTRVSKYMGWILRNMKP
ncbi:hypothetical protein WA026_002974 [Henosepilachna vigintioctopunctata]|uniref:CLIP domain-containing serine protease n=1 Tax=Henosepilachna vigintioctopunctata TaxID=420089 RepID=A0AAW1TLT5_9CUCU